MRGRQADGITQALTDWIAHHGVYAVFVVMAIDALLPAGGELTMLVAGALAAGAIANSDPVLLGHTLSAGFGSYVVLSLAGTLGYLLGSLVGWAIGRRGGRPLVERHGRWLHLDAERLARAEAWFDRRGRAAVFLGRLTPVVRSFISIPAGLLELPARPVHPAHAGRLGRLVLRLRGRRLGSGEPVRPGPSRLHGRRGRPRRSRGPRRGRDRRRAAASPRPARLSRAQR